jgi:hypothetical protein
MTKVKDEPRASVEGGCGVADGDGGAAEIGGTGSVEKSINEVRYELCLLLISHVFICFSLCFEFST